MRFYIKNQETTTLKKRYNIGYKIVGLVFGEFSFTLLKSYNIEYIYIYNFKKKLKKFFFLRSLSIDTFGYFYIKIIRLQRNQKMLGWVKVKVVLFDIVLVFLRITIYSNSRDLI